MMATFLNLTTLQDTKLLVNMDFVIQVEPNDYGVEITMDEGSFFVKESFEQISEWMLYAMFPAMTVSHKEKA